MDFSDKTAVLKNLVSFVVGYGTMRIVSGAIQNNTDTEGKVKDRLAVGASSFVLGAIAAEKTREWTDRRIDSLVAQYNNYVQIQKDAE